MTNRFEEYLSRMLQTFDSIDLDVDYQRRVAVKPLYDYFQTLILEVAVRFCGQNRNSLKNCHLKTRWEIVKSSLRIIEDPTKWDNLVESIHNIRSKVEHNDYKIPKKEALLQIRQLAPSFKDWILRVGKQYHRESSGFSFIQKFLLTSDWYIKETDRMLDIYGEKPPYLIEGDVFMEEEHSYERMKSLKDYLESRIQEIDGINDLVSDDFDNLIDLIRIIEHLNAKEDVLLKYSICPKCGGRIIETERAVGGSLDDPMPSAIIYRGGCERCDYEVHSETIQL